MAHLRPPEADYGEALKFLDKFCGPLAQLPLKADQPRAGARVRIMFNVYVIKSLRNGKRYAGYTSKEVLVRLKEHNSGSNKFTKQNGPFDMYYSETCEGKTEAIQREKFLKSGQGRKFLDSLS